MVKILTGFIHFMVSFRPGCDVTSGLFPRSVPDCGPWRIRKARKEPSKMATRIYVGGLPYSTTEQELNTLFSSHGTVASANVITDKYTGQAKGFGFVEMSTDAESQAAIRTLNGTMLGGRTLTVNEAKPREERSSGGGGNRNGGGHDGGNRW
jgi:RNA recognition motif-containing protein